MTCFFKGTSKMLIIVLIIVIVAIVGLGFSTMFKPKPTTTSSPATFSTTPASSAQPSPPISLPLEDVSGNDLFDVPRYMPSIRLYYNNETYGNVVFVDITYYTQGKVDDVVSFYETQMPNYNWLLLNKSTVKEELEVPGIPVKIKSYVFLDFRRPGCTDPQTCLPYAKISIGEITLDETKYTIVQISFEDYAKKPETTTPTSTPTQTPSDFGAQFVEFMSKVLADAFNIPKPKLVDYQGGKSPLATFDIGMPITDVSEAAEKVKSSLVVEGIPESIIIVEKEDSSLLVTVISWMLDNNMGTITVRLKPESNIVETYFVQV